jgi:hypothetical protein
MRLSNNKIKVCGQWSDEIEHAARDNDYRVRAVAYRSIAQFRFRQKLELLREEEELLTGEFADAEKQIRDQGLVRARNGDPAGELPIKYVGGGSGCP